MVMSSNLTRVFFSFFPFFLLASFFFLFFSLSGVYALHDPPISRDSQVSNIDFTKKMHAVNSLSIRLSQWQHYRALQKMGREIMFINRMIQRKLFYMFLRLSFF